jgi:RHS repeat-associated protein
MNREQDRHRSSLRTSVLRAGALLLLACGLLAAPAWAQHFEPMEFYHYDALGSVRLVVSFPHDADTYTVSRHDYLPFGEEIQPGTFGRTTDLGYGIADTTPQRFTGKERDPESNLDYFGARYYSAPQGRFISPDAPFADQHVGDPQSWNLYAYVRNRPLIHIDADGRETRLVHGEVIKGDPNSYGHSSLIISRNGRSVAYDFGRYGSAAPSNRLMAWLGVKNSGPGILRVWKDGDTYLKDQSRQRDQTVYTFKTSKAEEAAITAHFDGLRAEGQQKARNSRFTTIQTKDDYAISTNSCVTQSAGSLSDAVGTRDKQSGEGYTFLQGMEIGVRLSGTLAPSDVKAAGELLVTEGLATKREIKQH